MPITNVHLVCTVIVQLNINTEWFGSLDRTPFFWGTLFLNNNNNNKIKPLNIKKQAVSHGRGNSLMQEQSEGFGIDMEIAFERNDWIRAIIMESLLIQCMNGILFHSSYLLFWRKKGQMINNVYEHSGKK